jgi:hypothetical protein
MHGPARLKGELESLGYDVQELRAPDGTPFVVINGFVVPGGRFGNRVIDLAIQATPDFPRTVASAIHVRSNPQLFEYSDSLPSVRNIVVSALGPDWRYWSHNFGWQEERSARRLLSQVNGIFSNA